MRERTKLIATAVALSVSLSVVVGALVGGWGGVGRVRRLLAGIAVPGGGLIVGVPQPGSRPFARTRHRGSAGAPIMVGVHGSSAALPGGVVALGPPASNPSATAIKGWGEPALSRASARLRRSSPSVRTTKEGGQGVSAGAALPGTRSHRTTRNIRGQIVSAARSSAEPEGKLRKASGKARTHGRGGAPGAPRVGHPGKGKGQGRRPGRSDHPSKAVGRRTDHRPAPAAQPAHHDHKGGTRGRGHLPQRPLHRGRSR